MKTFSDFHLIFDLINKNHSKLTISGLIPLGHQAYSSRTHPESSSLVECRWTSAAILSRDAGDSPLSPAQAVAVPPRTPLISLDRRLLTRGSIWATVDFRVERRCAARNITRRRNRWADGYKISDRKRHTGAWSFEDEKNNFGQVFMEVESTGKAEK